MAFDQATRNRLQRFVSDARKLLTEEFSRRLQGEYGMDPKTGEVADLKKLAHLDDARLETARLLRDTMEHYLASGPAGGRKEVLDRIVREQAFTVLNRLCALRMAEARGLLIESVENGLQSKGFQLYTRLAQSALGERADAYRAYLFSVFDEFALDLAVLFDRFSPQGRLFPREEALLELLDLINHPDLAELWAEDETIGWVYQYFNSVEERRAMRDASAAPRNSRELAVRNQFFTPRYVVEFLTDNTLGRIWYEMTQGETALKDRCRYLVRRPDEVFLGHMTDPDGGDSDEGIVEAARLLQEGAEDTFPDFTERDMQRVINLAHTVNGYARHPHGQNVEGEWWPWWRREQLRKAGTFDGASTQDLLDILFSMVRADRHSNMGGPFCGGDPYAVEIPREVRRRVLESRRDDLSQEELLRQPVIVPFRPKKDPRDLKILDPACGSGHFLLYAFDLIEDIYEETWQAEDGPKSEATGATLRDDYPDLEALRRDVPRLVVEHNLHGIDIDPRAVQIAGLSLWLRAQKSWQVQGVKPQERPRIRRSHVVCAEPMPGEQDLLSEFTNKHLASTSDLLLLSQLVQQVFDAMKLAGEAGFLLKIEKEIAKAVENAKEKWRRLSQPKQSWLFNSERPKPEQLPLDVLAITDAKFWEEAEERLYEELQSYATFVRVDHGVQRRLFANDTVRGFAFIDLCRQRYDSVLMNPPFGESSKLARSYVGATYPRTKHDAFAAFVEVALLRLAPHGRLGAITSRTGFFLSSFQKWREEILLSEHGPTLIADLGMGVLDGAMVETAAYIVEKQHEN